MSELFERYKESLVRTYNPPDINFNYGKGSYLYDDKGTPYLDFTSGIGVNSLGHSNPKIVNAIKKQAEQLLHISNLYMNENSIILAEKILKLSGMNKVFFSNSGAESNEGAIKIARKYSYDKYGLGRGTIVSLKNSFHGRTMTTLMATGQDKFHKYFYPFPEGFKYCNPDEKSFEECLDQSVCAVILEGIQGEGGVNPLNDEFVEHILSYCNKHDIITIFDEVQTGIGRTGYFLYSDKFSKKPDIITLAKGLGGGVPIGAILCGPKVENTLSLGEHGTTFGGNPLVSAVASIILDEFITDDILIEINKKSAFIFNELKKINSDNVLDIKGAGLMIGIEVKGDISEYVKVAREKGLLILTAGANTIRLLPPLNIENDDITKGISILREIFA